MRAALLALTILLVPVALPAASSTHANDSCGRSHDQIVRFSPLSPVNATTECEMFSGCLHLVACTITITAELSGLGVAAVWVQHTNGERESAVCSMSVGSCTAFVEFAWPSSPGMAGGECGVAEGTYLYEATLSCEMVASA